MIPTGDEIPADVIKDIAWDVPKTHKLIGASGFMTDRVRIDVGFFFLILIYAPTR